MDIISLIIGMVIGGSAAFIFKRSKETVIAGLELTIKTLNEQVFGLQQSNSALASEVGILQHVSADAEEYKATIHTLNRQLTSETAALAAIQTQLDLERQQSAEKLKGLQDTSKTMKEQFENLANKILEDTGRKFNEAGKKNIETLLGPVKEQIKDFGTRLEVSSKEEAERRGELKQTLKNLAGAHKRLSEDAENLTAALKGDKKLQGCWGELVLERVLEESGLEKGREYQTQGGYKNTDGRTLKPDVIVDLPDSRQVVVDAKVSLVAYERYHSAETAEEETQAIKDHTSAVKTHISTLSDKNYEDLYGIQSLDFTILFMPMDGALMAAIKHDPKLVEFAARKKIILVGPTTLVLSLKIIKNMWHIQTRNQNVEFIARKAGELYDKFCNFLVDVEKIGTHLGRAQKTYNDARNKISGHGGLLGRCEIIKEKGARTSKLIPAVFQEEAGLDIEEGGAA